MIRFSFPLIFLMTLLGCSEAPRIVEIQDEPTTEVRMIEDDTLTNQVAELTRYMNSLPDSKRKTELKEHLKLINDVLEDVAERDSVLNLQIPFCSSDELSRFK